ncbi:MULTISPECIES: acyl CoA:acetate/3-ketoacid CoA transferase [Aerococcus]|uniref:Acyl CoA:acetate/3-ketoacid CoA transferase n=3 Tax=Aerococcus TaxID=1375 RepID=A0ABT4C2G5_9LACT|nr:MULTISPECIES: acyl CoA:acetate/3-ketoacid CoA transferase [Aerococcus]AEA01300.1 CoA transferase [Aerococcus sp. Group 1]AMB95738.1 CoA-transferase [Aerococcus urinae]KAA9238830.1 acyl CoA:acetate/3-ketoacid CoA transferase [Aerococcus urinae]KAA9292612.1 acyl CoA:acetate/3-ketoacid CoA transferase [Aerococcus mictus]KAA9299503.1 acyl CoA:acetate/3-ketoacid CoA transferase [Aerococcus tenax]
MGKKKPVISRREAADLIKDNDLLATCTFGLGGLPEDLLVGVKERYEEEQHPKDITFMWSCGIGNNKPGRGADHLLADGLVKRIIAGHVGSSPGMVDKVVNNEVEAYLLPQGVFTQLYRAIAGNKPFLTKVGLQTYVDPRLEGAKATEKTTEELIELAEFGGEEWLKYPDFDIDVAFIRGSFADEKGNMNVEDETCILEQLELAMATKKKGGTVIAQVKQIVENNSLDPKSIVVPGGLIDYIVVADPEYHYQTMGTYYSPELAGKINVPVDSVKPAPLSSRKVIGRRAAMELQPDSVINLGIGTPDMVASVAQEEGVADEYVTTLEMGIWGGSAAGGLDFGASRNADASIAMANQFDFYDGNGLDLSVLGIGQIDQYGNNNVTKFGPKVPGPGGFINISQNTKNLVFVGTLTVGGKSHIEDGKLVIDEQGRGPKFLKEVEQVSFSGKYAQENDQNILYVTERAVFDLHEGKVRLIEIAPGIDLQKDVLDQMEFEPEIAEDLKEMNPDIFKEEWGGLKEIIDAKSKK